MRRIGQTPTAHGNTQDVYVHRVGPNPSSYNSDTYGASGLLLQPFALSESADDPTKFFWYCYAPNGVVRAAMNGDRWPVWYVAALTETGMTKFRGGIITLAGSDIPADRWGIWQIAFTTAGVLSASPASGNGTGYLTAALAQAAFVSFGEEQVALGYICVQAPAATPWIPGTSHHHNGTVNPAQSEEFVLVDKT